MTGFWQPDGFSVEDAQATAEKMANCIAHRGPDDSGVWVGANEAIALAHRRLSILDLSPAGHQPMVSLSGRYVIVLNGEIYNHLELRRELDAPSLLSSPTGGGGAMRWRGHSDTETLLAGFDAWGVDATLRKCVGMFAIALCDRQKRSLVLSRDRLGEKPLYYGWQNGVFLFGSELKALRAHPAFAGEIDRDALALQLRHNCIPAPYSIYKGIRKLPPGTWLRVDVHSLGPNPSSGGRGELVPQAYWSLCEVAERGQADPFLGPDAEAVAALDARLRESVALQMAADVPLGAFLSGGVDSSTIVALMQAQSLLPVKTFTIGFHEEGYNEAEHAKAVARHLGTEHTELYVSSKQAREVIPRLPALYDEPFSDSSQIPTFLVSQLTRQHVTVSLSGDAGDELFGGYNRYHAAIRLMRKFAWLPLTLRLRLVSLVNAMPVSTWALLGGLFRIAQGPEKVRKVVEIISSPNREAFYRQLVSHWKYPADVVIGATEPPTVLTSPDAWPDLRDFEHSMMALDAMSYLPDDILVKVDRAAMGVSLETRVPMLDHRLVEFAWSLPLSMKIRNGEGKWILRQVLYKYVPRELIERPKMGFGVPIDSWLRGPLRDWAESLLDESRLRQEGYFHPGPIRQKWREHLSGQRNWQYYLWDVLMFQAWLEAQT